MSEFSVDNSNVRVKDHVKQSTRQQCEECTSLSGESESWDLKIPQTRSSETRFVALFAFLIVLVGCAASASFLYVGITAAQNDVQDQFEGRATEVVQEIELAWLDYEKAGNWIHESCRKRDFNREDFRELYEYLRSDGLEFQAAEFIPNITHKERARVEAEDREYYAKNYPDVEFHGFKGFEPDPEGGVSIQNRSEQPFYFPVRYLEPVESNAAAAGFDLYSSESRKATIHHALDTWKPALTNRLQLVQETDPSAYSVLLMHPGVRLQAIDPGIKPKDVSLMVVRIPSLLERASRNQVESLGMYVYDKSIEPPEFLGAVSVVLFSTEDDAESARNETRKLEFLPEIELEDLIQNLTAASSKMHREEIHASSHKWEVVVVPVNDAYEPDLLLVIFTGTIIAFAAVALGLCLFLHMKKITEMNKIMLQADAEKAIVSNLFPSKVHERLAHDAAMARVSATKSNSAKGKQGDNIFGSSPIAEFYPEITIMFADLVGFTAWSSVRDPAQVFTLLENLYHGFDLQAKRRGVFKVETIGDCYVACSGIPNPRKDHALIMAKFAVDCLLKMPTLTQGLEASLGPGTSELSIRVGLHSGPVTAGVLRGSKSRFQLFGDVVNCCSRIESTSESGRAQVSEATAQLIRDGGKGNWLEAKRVTVFAKGKGEISTYFLDVNAIAGIPPKVAINATPRTGEASFSSTASSELDLDPQTKKLIQWNVHTLEHFLRQIIVRRVAAGTTKKAQKQNIKRKLTGTDRMVLDEVMDIIPMPEFHPDVVRKAEEIDPETIELAPQVLPQLTEYVTSIACLYNNTNPFHSFLHATHVGMSVVKLLSRIVNPKVVEIKSNIPRGKIEDGADALAVLHDHTFGITSDPITQFACVFSALIHDLAHEGVPNMVLVKEESPLARKYQNKSVLEQNSLDIAWKILMESKYDDLRACLFQTEADLAHFRAVLVNSVMATDIMDKKLNELRKNRWDMAFAVEKDEYGTSSLPKNTKESANRKATIVIEHLIQASDVAHTMQHWCIYQRWNKRFFFEMLDAYKGGRLDKDPSEDWFEGEIAFFDFYIIPLAKKLETCGVFGVSSYEYKNYAMENRREWVEKGRYLVATYLEEYNATYATETGSFDNILDYIFV